MRVAAHVIFRIAVECEDHLHGSPDSWVFPPGYLSMAGDPTKPPPFQRDKVSRHHGCFGG
jgi:hypothetical protein